MSALTIAVVAVVISKHQVVKKSSKSRSLHDWTDGSVYWKLLPVDYQHMVKALRCIHREYQLMPSRESCVSKYEKLRP
jgi:hypothetical protein